MDIMHLVARARDNYIRQFREFAKSQRSKCRQGAAEVKMEIDDRHGVFGSLCCVDFVVNDEQIQVIELSPDEFSFDPVKIEYGPTSLSVQSMQWDDMVIRHDVDEIPQEQLRHWFERWFDPDDLRYDEHAELSNNIHSLLVRPRMLSVDLGTAEPAALMDILELLKNAGASSIDIERSRKVGLN